MKNKKASEFFAPDTFVFWIIYGIVLALVAVFFVIKVNKIGSSQSQIYEKIETYFLIQRFYSSRECFIQDQSHSLIDLDKFTQDTLHNCYKVSDGSMPAFKIRLVSTDTNFDKTIKTSNWNINFGAEERKSPRDRLVTSQNKIYNGVVTIEIQNAQ